MKRLYMIGGTMGVGKTAVCQYLKTELKKSVFLDGDWCWDAHPFQVNDETKTMVMENICFLLNQFVHCSSYENIIFCWVLHEQCIIDSIIEKIDQEDLDIKIISLVCGADTLRYRLQKDVNEGIRQEDVIERSLQRIPLYDKLDTIKINTNDMDIESIGRKIMELS